MLKVTMQPHLGIAVLEPDGPLTEDDFTKVTEVIDPYLESAGILRGLIIVTEHFPGWNSFEALISHLTFVKNHHHFIEKLAMVTNSVAGNLFTVMAGHFVHAEIKLFAFDDLESARQWVLK